MISILRYAVIFFLVLSISWTVLFFLNRPSESLDAPVFEQGELTIKTTAGLSYKFNIEIAETPQQRRYGLMYRETLAENQAMLFLFEPTDYISFWMKNTPLSLDIFFIDKNGMIVDIAENTTPFSENSIIPSLPARAAIEVPGGTAKRLDIQPGDEVDAPYFFSDPVSDPASAATGTDDEQAL